MALKGKRGIQVILGLLGLKAQSALLVHRGRKEPLALKDLSAFRELMVLSALSVRRGHKEPLAHKDLSALRELMVLSVLPGLLVHKGRKEKREISAPVKWNICQLHCLYLLNITLNVFPLMIWDIYLAMLLFVGTVQIRVF